MTEEPEFIPGDIVTLISGGPKMTVSCNLKTVGKPDKITCIWFESLKLNTASLPKETLVYHNAVLNTIGEPNERI